MTRILVAAIVVASCAFGAAVHAEDSPQFRGVGGVGVAETPLPVKWDKNENIRWKAALPGRGLSCPVVVGKRVFVTACSGPDQERLHVLCYDVASGDKLWHRQIWATGATVCHQKSNMAAPTPVTDGKHIYALFATCDLACYDMDGNLVWYRSLEGDYPTLVNNVGMAASPVLWKNRFIACLETSGASFAVGIDTATGQNAWKVERPKVINWVTPLIIKNHGKDEVLFQGPSDVSAHDPATGVKLWSVAGSFSTIPSPSFGDGLVMAPGGKMQAIRPPSGDDKAKIVWENAKLATGYSSPLVYRGLVYTISTRGIVNCADALTGRTVFSQRIDGTFSASPLAVDGKIYFVNEEGATTVMQAGAQPKFLSVNNLGDTFLASPAAAGGALYLRSDNALYCIAAKK